MQNKPSPISIAIWSLIDCADKNKILSGETKENMTVALDKFVRDSVEKFIKGQTEHGGLLQDRDLDKEIQAEAIDFFWYNAAKQWRKENTNVSK